MDFSNILISGLFATVVMTTFSYIVAKIRSKQFREPELLNHLLSSFTLIPGNYSKNSLLGWLLHFLIGISFAILFNLLVYIFSLKISFLIGAIFGLLAGFIAIIFWHLMFKFSNNPPEIKLKEFYIQLLIAHILFGISIVFIFI